jgi:hypothetical protein
MEDPLENMYITKLKLKQHSAQLQNVSILWINTPTSNQYFKSAV